MSQNATSINVHLYEGAPLTIDSTLIASQTTAPTAVLVIQGGTVDVQLLLWGSPDETWNRLDQIVDTIRQLKRRIVESQVVAINK